MYSIWSILEIEPTTNKKIIQQAYAEKLKQYHPEDNPEEFQRLREAYKDAMAYAKGQSFQGRTVQGRLAQDGLVWSKPAQRKLARNEYQQEKTSEDVFEETSKKKQTIFIENNQRVRKKKEYINEEWISAPEEEKKESIPEYIRQLGSAEAGLLYKEEVKKYVLCLKQNLIGKKGRKSCKTIEKLFEDMQFRLVMNLDEFLVCLKEEVSDFAKWNQPALRFFIKKVKQVMQENTDHNLTGLKRYLESRRIIRNYKLITFWAVFIILCICFLPLGVSEKMDEYTLSKSPHPQQVCLMLKYKYGIDVNVDNIERSCVKNTDIYTKDKNPKVIKYVVEYEQGEERYYFNGIYLPKEKSPITFDLERQILKKYLKEYMECAYSLDWEVGSRDVTRIQTKFQSEEDKEAFETQFYTMMDNLFHDPMMRNSDYVFDFEIGEESMLLMDAVHISMNKSDYVEKYLLLSEELDGVLQYALLKKAYEEGEYTENEYYKKKIELQNQKLLQ